MIRLTSLTCASLIALVATPANAEFIFGGDLTIERDIFHIETDDTAYTTHIRGEVAVGYDSGEFAFGVGTRFDEEHDEFEIDDDNAFYFAKIGPVTVSHGLGVGAGTVISEDYFALDDTTRKSIVATRIDLDLGSVQVAISQNEDDEAEFGMSAEVAGYNLRAGYEESSEEVELFLGRDMGNWGYHLIVHNELDESGTDDQIAGTLLYDVSASIQVAGNIAFDGNGDFHSYGLAGWYEFGDDLSSAGPATLRVEYFKEFDVDGPDDLNSLEMSLNIPFGKAAPGSYARKTNKEELSGFGF